MRRYLILLAAILIQLCLGATYSWSLFVHPLKEWTGLGQGTVQLPFSVFYFTFPATLAISGCLVSSIGPRICAMAGGILFGGGWILAGFSANHFLLTTLGIGLLGGVGVGFAYIVPISTCICWFPKHKGLVTGIAVAGFGGGAALVSKTAGFLTARYQYTPFQTFYFLGFVFLILVTLAGTIMQNPPGQKAQSAQRLPLRSTLANRTFRILYFCMFTGLAAGFAINANLKELYISNTIQAGVNAVVWFAISNALGRIIWGWIFDRITAIHAIQANLVFQALILFCSPLILRSDYGLQGFAFLTGFNYGGVLVLYASSIARSWGAERVAQIYGWLFTANIPAALSPLLAGYAYDSWGNFTLPLWMIAALLITATFMVRKRVES